MKERHELPRRGSALVNVLALASIMFLLCFVIASLSTADLDLAAAYRAHVQNEQLARAAITEFAYEADLASSDRSPVEASPPPNWLARYAGNAPVFPDGGQHLPGSVKISFDSNSAYYSVDNSENSQSASGWADRNSEKKSIPPYCVDLVMRVNTGGQTEVFDAVLQRRWPYVLTSPGPIRILGSLPEHGESINPSLLSGGIYCLNATLDVPNDDGRLSYPPLTSHLIDLLASLRVPPAEGSQIVVGGGVGRGPTSAVSEGNEIHGNVDFAATNNSQRGVEVRGQSNIFKGNERFNIHSQRDTNQLARALEMPSPSHFTQPDPLPPTFVPALTADPNNPEQSQKILLMAGDTLLTPGVYTSKSSGQPEGGKILINGTVSNSRLVYTGNQQHPIATDHSDGKTLEIRDCELYVNGDLNLESANTSIPSTNPDPPTLRGSNATLVVNGTLSLSRATIDAQNQGMVILCRYLVCQATGSFRGLILVQSGAIFYPHPNPNLSELEMSGSIVVGGHGTFQGQALGSSQQYAAIASLTPGLTLWSSHLKYDPSYVLNLHRLGYFEVLSLRRLE